MDGSKLIEGNVDGCLIWDDKTIVILSGLLIIVTDGVCPPLGLGPIRGGSVLIRGYRVQA